MWRTDLLVVGSRRLDWRGPLKKFDAVICGRKGGFLAMILRAERRKLGSGVWVDELDAFYTWYIGQKTPSLWRGWMEGGSDKRFKPLLQLIEVLISRSFEKSYP